MILQKNQLLEVYDRSLLINFTSARKWRVTENSTYLVSTGQTKIVKNWQKCMCCNREC